MKAIAIAALTIAILAIPRAEAAGAEAVEQPIRLIESACVRAALAVAEARQGGDVTQTIARLRADDESIKNEILNRMEAAEIERGIRLGGQAPQWDTNKEALECLERNRHVALAYLTAE